MIRKPIGITAPYRAEDDDDIQDYRRPWVGLTDEEIDNIWHNSNPTNFEAHSFARAIESAHGIK